MMYFKKKAYFNDFQIALLVCVFISIWPFMPSGNFFNNLDEYNLLLSCWISFMVFKQKKIIYENKYIKKK